MIRLGRILFPTDFSACANQALDHALFLARQYGAELHMLHAIVLHEEDPHNPAAHVDVAAVHERLRKLARDDMAAAIDPHKELGVRVVMEERRGIAPADVILSYAQEHEIDLIVIGTHGRRGLGHMLLGSVAEEVVRMATCPVLTIRQRERPLALAELNRILVPLDFSDHARTALGYAREIAAAYGAELQLLHVVEQTLNPGFYSVGIDSVLELRPDVREQSTREMRRLLDEVPGAEVETSFHVIEGRAARDIVDFAREHDSQLVVIATHGLTGIQQLLLGSVAEKVVRAAPCPVFTVKVFGRSLIVD